MSSDNKQPIGEISARLTEKLNEVRAMNGWSIGEMAKRCGLPKSTMDGYLKGVSPSLDALEKISKGTSISMAGLLAGWSYSNDQSFREIFAAARDELFSFFDRAANWSGGPSLEISDGKIGGMTPDELAHKLALEIAINAKGFAAYNREISNSDTGSS